MLTNEEIANLFSNVTGFDIKLNDLAIEDFARAVETITFVRCIKLCQSIAVDTTWLESPGARDCARAIKKEAGLE